MHEPVQAGYCDIYPTGTWYSESYRLLTSDDRVFLYLYDGAYAKIYDLSVTPDPDTNNGTIVSFKYEIQTGGLTLFTSN